MNSAVPSYINILIKSQPYNLLEKQLKNFTVSLTRDLKNQLVYCFKHCY